MGRKTRTIPAQSRGLESKKTPAAGEVFFLTSPFIELIRTWHPKGLTNSEVEVEVQVLYAYLPALLLERKGRESLLRRRGIHLD
jgi:hypothetical protein